MKNLYLLPTDKPNPNTLLVKDKGEVQIFDKTFYDMWKVHQEFGNFAPTNVTYKNIYITSDEKTKENDWCYSISTKNIFKNINPNLKSVDKKKIILTTDQDLIKDGVQAIDDEFLEWFVNNPSCESADIKTENICGRCYSNDFDNCWSAKECSDGKYDKIKYKIIFPKEEPKDVLLGYKTSIVAQMLDEPKQEWQPIQGEAVWIKVFSNWSSGIYIGYDTFKCKHLVRESDGGGGNLFESEEIFPYHSMPNKSKNESLEEAALINYKELYEGEPLTQDVPIDAFINGAKWQQERSYSEEDLKLAFESNYESQSYGSSNLEDDFKKWFEQFKNHIV